MIRSLTAFLSPSSLMSPVLLSAANRAALQAALSLDSSGLESYLRPTENDYIHVPIRALSAAPVQYDTINFGHNNGKALKDAVGLFAGLTVFKDHNHAVDGWIGMTSMPYWDDQTADCPPGVNMMLDIDAKADPKTARGLLSGALNSGSVTVTFDFEKSHPDMKEEDFFWKMGTKVAGKMVQANVTKITRLMEYSVVWQGADAFAKVLTPDGRIITPGKASNSLSLNTGVNNMDWKALAALLGLSLGDTVTQESFEAAVKAQNLNVTALAAAATELTTLKTELTTVKGQLSASETKVVELTTGTTKLTTDLATSTTQVAALNAQVAELKVNAEFGKAMLKDTRDEALRLYNLVEGDKATEAMRQLIGNADLAVSKSFVTSYTPRAEQVAPLKCKACGSAELSRGAAVPRELPEIGSQLNALEDARRKATLESIHGKAAQ